MKGLATILIFLSTSLLTYSQFEYYKPAPDRIPHKKGQVILSASPAVLFNTPNGTQIAGGIKMQLFLGKTISIDGDFVFSCDYYHLSPGLIGIPLGIVGLLLSSDEGDMRTFLFSVVAIAISFEHLSLHIPVAKSVDLSPYVSLLRFRSAYEYGNYKALDYISEQLCLASGVQIDKYFGRFVLSPYAEYTLGYKDQISGLNVGIYCGIFFPNR